MQDENWLFDVVMDLCEKAEQLGFPEMSSKLEEALDVYLEEKGKAAKPSVKSENTIVSFGPIALAQESFMFGHRRPVAVKNTKPAAHMQKARPDVPAPAATAPVAAVETNNVAAVETTNVAVRRETPSAVLQQLKAIRAKRAAQQQHEDAEASGWFDKTG